ncbi:hypothetical protein WJ69_34400 [Burkholderia ubonensis]|uniref:type II secretion system F family protein n=1 Tax=Burkholderia ubonensis TaxID=101571 RepID=UPI0007527194|nr:type II secretion system F family protein [Burkholderia ubonensis]KVN98545.1 hypothetical protein WJ69_34400 [Burkholderia ubonensis]
MDAILIGIVLVLVCTVMLAGYCGYSLLRDRFGARARTLTDRVGAIRGGKTASAQPVSILKQTRRADRVAARATRGVASLVWLLQHSGLNWSLGRFGSYSALGALVGLVAGTVAGLPFGVCATLLCVGALTPFGIVRHRSRKRSAKMDAQLPDVLDMLASMLRAGHSLPSSLAMLSDEMPAPIGEEFRLLHGEMTYGGSAEDALNRLVERTRSEDMRCFVMAILVQRETGGKLTDMLTDLSGVVRERLKLFGKIRTLSAEGRASAWVLTLLPIISAFAINIINPPYLRVFWVDPTGIRMLEASIVMLLLGNLWMRKLIQIRV